MKSGRSGRVWPDSSDERTRAATWRQLAMRSPMHSGVNVEVLALPSGATASPGRRGTNPSRVLQLRQGSLHVGAVFDGRLKAAPDIARVDQLELVAKNMLGDDSGVALCFRPGCIPQDAQG